jgi:hypothetical protein
MDAGADDEALWQAARLREMKTRETTMRFMDDGDSSPISEPGVIRKVNRSIYQTDEKSKFPGDILTMQEKKEAPRRAFLSHGRELNP